jgi:hypothetical protein
MLSADAMAQEPRRFVAYAEHPLGLIRTHAFTRFTHQQNGEKPFIKRQVRIVENGVSERRKLVLAIQALELVILRQMRDALRFAARTFNAIR